jgi:CHAT domain-containing protein
LHNLPFAALRDAEQGLWFGEQRQLFSLPSLSTYGFLLAKRKPSATPNALVVGIDLYTQANLRALAHAESEAQEVASSAYFTGVGNTVLIGADASKAAVLANVAKFNVLHFAVHAQVDRTLGRFSRLYLSGQDSLSVADVYDLDLRRASLVVLSACDTGVGTIDASDDITSLNRAFLYAGTPTVLASLIEVDDEATGVLMIAFYEALQQGDSKAEALQAAQAHVRDALARSNPYFWAYFTLTGDPGQFVVR